MYHLFVYLEGISGIGLVVIRFGFGRVFGINGYGIACDGVTGEITLGDVGSGHGEALEGVVGMEYCGR